MTWCCSRTEYAVIVCTRASPAAGLELIVCGVADDQLGGQHQVQQDTGGRVVHVACTVMLHELLHMCTPLAPLVL